MYALAALFSLDSFGGGFVVQSLLALWLFHRFGMSVASDRRDVLLARACSRAFSYLVAVRIARRIGLVNTMVFTHLPANLCLSRCRSCTDLPLAIALLLVRSALSQMDVPTRNSYVMAVVTPRRAAGRGRASPPCRAAWRRPRARSSPASCWRVRVRLAAADRPAR